MVNLPRFLCSFAIAAYLSTGAASAQFTVVVDQSNLTSNGNVVVSFSPFAGQIFTVGVTGRLEGIEVAPVAGTSVPTDIVELRVYDDNSMGQFRGMTSIPAVGFTPGAGVVPPPLSPTTIGVGYFDLSGEGIHINAGDQIYLQFRLEVDGNNIRLGTSSDVYAGGTATSGGVPVPGRDLAFKSFVVPCTSCVCGSAVFRNAGTNPASYSSELPILGGSFNATVDVASTGHAAALLFGFSSPTTLPLPGGQTLLAFGPAEILGLPVVVGSPANFELPIPNDVSLCGFAFSTQAAHFGGVTPFALSNALDLTLGV